MVPVEQENIADDEACVEDDHDQEPDISVPQPILYIRPKVEVPVPSYDGEQAEANWCDYLVVKS